MVLNSAYATSLRDNGSTATFDLETGGVDLDGNATVCVVSARNFTAINTIYNINDSSNTLQVAWYDSVTGYKITTVTVTNGAYDIFQLVAALSTAFAADYALGGNVALYSVSYVELTGKVTITATFDSVASTLYAFYIITNTYSAILGRLGFDLTAKLPLVSPYYGFQSLITTSTTTYSIEAGNLPNLYYPKMFYVCVDQIRTPNRVSLPSNEYGIVLCEFPATASFGELIFAESYNIFEHHIPNLKTNTLTIRIMDEDGKTIDWNGGTWIIVLGLSYGTQSINEDPTLGRTFRPLLHRTAHDPLLTSHERALKRNRY